MKNSTRARRRKSRTLFFEGCEARLLLASDMAASPDPSLFTPELLYSEISTYTGAATSDTLPAITQLQGTRSMGFDATPHQNPLNRFDVNGDLSVAPNDVLQLVNEINSGGGGTLPPISETQLPNKFTDVNGDRALTPADVLQVINRLNDPLYVSPPLNQSATTAEDRTFFSSTGILTSSISEDTSSSQMERDHGARGVHTASGSFAGILKKVEMTTRVEQIAGRVDSDTDGFGVGFSHSIVSTLTISGWGEIFLDVGQTARIDTDQTFTCCGIVEQEDDAEVSSAGFDIRARGQFHIEMTTIAERSNLGYSLQTDGGNNSQADYSQLTVSHVLIAMTADWMKVLGSTSMLTEDTYDYGSVPAVGSSFSDANTVFRGSGSGTISFEQTVDGSRLLGYGNDGFVRDNHRGATVTAFSDGVDMMFNTTGSLEASQTGYNWYHDRTGPDVESTTEAFRPGYSQPNQSVLDDVLADRDFLLGILLP